MACSTAYDDAQKALTASPMRWLVTGGAGFIGSHIVETLLRLRQQVVVLDDLSTGKLENLTLAATAAAVPSSKFLTFIQGDIRDLSTCLRASKGVGRVLHQAALGSVPRSLHDPRASHDVNVTGFINVLLAARDSGIRRVVYASSSSVYGDEPHLPKVEDRIGRPLSPYAVTKYADELYARVFAAAYQLEVVGLRYFNVFGPRQDPLGPYAAVMPRWFSAFLRDVPVSINGDGETTRDFCYVANAVQANILAALTPSPEAINRVYNVACGEQTSLNSLCDMIRRLAARTSSAAEFARPVHEDFRPGDIRHSLADISAARRLLGYAPTHNVREGLEEAAAWYAASHSACTR